MKKKILFIARFPPPIHGAALANKRYFEDKSLNKQFDMRAIKINDSESLEELGVVNLKKFFGFFKSFFKTLKELLFFRPATIYFEIAPKGVAFYRDSIFVWLCKLFNRRIVFQFHAKGVSGATQNFLARKYYGLIFKNSKVILLAKIIYEDVKRVIDKDQVVVICSGIEDNLTEKKFKEILKNRTQNKKTQLLFLSNMIESKGPIEVLEICKELNKKKVDFECNFVGKFQDEKFKERFESKLKRFNLGKKCKYLGPKYGEEKFDILGKTDYLVFPTQYPEETSPAVILEAFSFGIPVLSYANGAIPEIISKDYLGNIEKQGDWKNLTKDLIRRLKKKENSKKIRDTFKEKYLFNKSVEKLGNALK